MTRQEIEAKIAQIRSDKEAIAKQRNTLMASSEPKRGAQEPKTREEIEAKLAEIRAQKQAIAQERDALIGGGTNSTQPPEKEHSWRESLGELGRLPFSVLASAADTMSHIPAPFPSWGASRTRPSAREKLNAFHTPETGLGKFADTAGDYIGTSAALLGPGSVLSGASKVVGAFAPRVGKVGSVIADYGLGTVPTTGAAASSLAKHTLAGSSLASGLEHGAGWDPIAAGLAYPAALATKVAGHAGLNAVKNIPTPSRSAAKSLRDAIGEEEIAQILKELEAGPTSEFPKGYKPTTAELSENPTLLALQRAHMGHTPDTATHHTQNVQALHQALDNTVPGSATIEDTIGHAKGVKEQQEKTFAEDLLGAQGQRNRSIQDINAPESVSHKEHGENVRQATHKELSKLEANRSKASKPLYEAVHKSEKPIEVSSTLDLLDTLGKEGYQGTTKSDLERIRKILSTKKGSMQSQDLTDLVEAAYHPEKLSQEALKETVGEWGEAPSTLSARELHNLFKDVIDPAIKQSLQTKNMNRYYVLTSLKDSLTENLGTLPEFAKAQAKYRMLSEPINEILRDPSLGPLLKQDVYKSGYTSRAASHLPQFFKGISSEENAHALVKAIGKDKEALGKVQNYVRNQFIQDVVDESGKVNVRAIEQWHNNHHGAFVIDPQLRDLAHKMASAEVAIKRIEGGFQSTQKAMEPLFDALLGSDPEAVVNRIFSSTKSASILDNIVSFAKQDKTGKSLEGFKRGIVKYLDHHLSVASQTLKGEQNISFDKIRQLMAKKNSALRAVFSPDEIKELNKIYNAVKSSNRVLTAGAATGSPTESYKQLNEMLANDAYGAVEKLIPAGWMDWAYKGAKKAGALYTKHKKDQVVNYLVNPDRFKEAMTAQSKRSRKLDTEPLKNATRSAFLTFLQGNK